MYFFSLVVDEHRLLAFRFLTFTYCYEGWEASWLAGSLVGRMVGVYGLTCGWVDWSVGFLAS